MRSTLIALAAFLTPTLVSIGGLPANAADPPVDISSSSKAPVQTFGCGISGGWIGGWYMSIAAFNRTDVQLTSFTPRLRAYDRQTTKT